MNPRSLLLLGGLLGGSAVLAGSPARAEPPAATEPAFVELVPGLSVLRGPATTVLLAQAEDASILVDSELPKTAPALMKALEGRKPLRYVVNTHWHLDHVGGNQALAERGAVVVAHENAWRRVSEDTFLKHLNRTIPALPMAARPSLTLQGDGKLRLGTLEARLIHVPQAHTDGDLLVHFPAANVLHMGDCFFNGLYPIIDTGTGGMVDGLIAALDRGLTLADGKTRIVAGHGPIGGRNDLKAARDMLVDVRERVARRKRAGKTREQTLAAAPTQDLDAKWGQDWVTPAQIVGSVYDSLPAKP
ncbi:MBL fold metallo-hydrolase [Lysobacter sp. CA199]|uniref:MBL fold metallo-hydrolase n=1 Tax=Lysobacter sp. CA199 TaxID=3455608 RepID=UPI003F8D78C3